MNTYMKPSTKDFSMPIGPENKDGSLHPIPTSALASYPQIEELCEAEEFYNLASSKDSKNSYWALYEELLRMLANHEIDSLAPDRQDFLINELVGNKKAEGIFDQINHPLAHRLSTMTRNLENVLQL